MDSDTSQVEADQLPRNYTLVSFLGEGGYGEVLQCVKEDTQETVAVKIPHDGRCLSNELSLLNFLMKNNLDKCNIVRFIDSFKLNDGRDALAFEMLDATLLDYIFCQRDCSPLELHEVRTVVQQMATALNALKTVKVIHSDIKMDNIMLVDGDAQPLQVKLIDFGLALSACRAKQGRILQPLHYRAPEIILGLPFSEAIDMWSLGVVMSFIVLGEVLLPGNSEYDLMRCMVDNMGIPPDHLLSAGRYSKKLFVRTSPGHWRLKTPQEYCEDGNYRPHPFCRLDDLVTMKLNMVEADEKEECVDLLKAMLRMDANERITPSQVLAHPFITRGSVHRSSDSEPSTSHTAEPGTSKTAEPGKTVEPGTIQAAEPGKTAETGTIQAAGPGTGKTAEPGKTVEPGTIQAAEPGKTAETGTIQAAEPGTGKTAEPGTIQAAGPGTGKTAEPGKTVEPGTIQAAEPGKTAETGTIRAAEPGTIQADETSERRTDETSGSSSSSPPPPPRPGVVCSPSTEEEYKTCSSGFCGFRGVTLSTLYPGVILVQPAPADCCLQLDEDSGLEACSLDLPEELSESSPVVSSVVTSDPPSLFPLFEEQAELSAATPDDTEPKKKKQQKKKKKKNCFKRFFSWMKRTFCNRVGVCDDEGV